MESGAEMEEVVPEGDPPQAGSAAGTAGPDAGPGPDSMASSAAAAPRQSPEPCAHCGVGRERMLRCSGCKQTVYCCKGLRT